ncbi:LAETG motif-containing sortase-dependent surface protein [Kitasatospora sp. NPDC002965]|uniref:LAETG motif-containing sortase-dependent surface protein n=1 Tax=Kitasatospora sp. NPDC002965 TaxID=3154775 RepID=UPI0033A128CC
MRSSRLLAASTLLALSLGTTVGAATAGAAAVSPSPTTGTSASPTASPTTSPTAPTASPTGSGTPSTSASPTGTGTPSATASPSTTRSPGSSATPSATPTGRPTAPLPTPSIPCPGGYQLVDLKVTGTGLAGTTLTKGGAAQEMTATVENTGSVDLQKFSTYLFVTDIGQEPVLNPLTWGKEAFTGQVKLPGGDWKPLELAGATPLDLGTHKLAKGQKLTLQVRIAATAQAPVAKYHAELGGWSEYLPAKDVPGSPVGNGCVSFSGVHKPADHFTVADASGAPSAAATGAAASPKASTPAGPHLAETGSSSNTLPIAAGGAAVLAAGAGTLFVLRRRKAGAHA